MTDVIAFIQQNGTDLLQAAANVVAAASVVANFTRTDKDNKAVGVLSTVIHFLAVNFFAVAKK